MYFSTKTIKNKGIQILQAKTTVNYHNKIKNQNIKTFFFKSENN